MNELLETENRVLDEMRNVYRMELQDRLQAALEKTQGEAPDVAGLARKRKVKLTLTTTLGSITLVALKGYNPKRKAWVVPIRDAWGLTKHQRMTPALQRRIVCTAVETGSYEKAARLSGEWDVDTSDDAIRDCIMAVGNRALSNPLTTPCVDAAGPDDVLILMMDGWMARHRGEDWGSRLRAEGLERIHWHEIKSAILYRLSSHVQINPKRRALISKHVVAVPAETDPVDFGLRVQQEAMRMGMAKAKRVYVVMDGAIWLWNLFEDRFKLCATGTLDFYHASQHLHTLADALFPNNKPSASLWCHDILHALKHRSTRKLFRILSELVAQPPSNDKATIAAIKDACDYFDSHKDHMNYPAAAKLNLPIGSGSMESQCSQFQDRLKRRGQFWSNPGSSALIEVIQRHQNGEVASLLAA
jgi:hypothetical protein